MSAMKETTFTTSVYSCSLCKYWSLSKQTITRHIDAKCNGGTVVSQEKLLTHRDVSFELDDKATLYQCSDCGYTSTQVTPVRNHIRAKCPSATVVSEKRKLIVEEVPAVVQGNVQAIMNVGVSNAPINQTNLILVIQANSREEFDARLKILYKVFRNDVDFENPMLLPSTVLKGFEKENPALDNKMFTNNSVVCLTTKNKTPVVQYAAQELVNIYDIMLKFLEKNDTHDEDGVEYDEDLVRFIINECIHEKTISTIKTQKKSEDFQLLRQEIAEMLRKDPDRQKTYYTDEYKIAVQNLGKPLTKIPYHNKDKTRKPQKMVKQSLNDTYRGLTTPIPQNQAKYTKYQENAEDWQNSIVLTREMIADIAEYYRTKTKANLKKHTKPVEDQNVDIK